MRTVKYYFGLFFFLLALNVHAAISRVDYRASRLQAMYVFLTAITENEGPIQLKDLYLQSTSNNTKYQELAVELSRIQESYFGADIQGRERDSLFLTQPLFSRNLAEYRQRTEGVLPPAVHTRLFEIFAEFLPVFDRLVWQPHGSDTERFRKNIEKATESWHFNESFELIKRFLRAELPPSASFYVGFIPVPKGHSYLGAVHYRNGIAIAVGTEDFNPSALLPYLFSEVSRSLMQNQKIDFKSEINNYFLSQSASRYSAIALDSYVESISNSIARYFSQRKGVPFTQELSFARDNRSFIDNLAKSVEAYFNQSKTFDRELAVRYVGLFKEEFPRSIYENENIFRRVVFLCDNQTISADDLEKKALNVLKIFSVDTVSPAIYGSKVFRADDLRTPIVVLTDVELGRARELFKVRKWLLADYEKVLKAKGSAILRSFDPSGRAFVLIKLRKADQLNSALEKLKDKFGSEPSLKTF